MYLVGTLSFSLTQIRKLFWNILLQNNITHIMISTQQYINQIHQCLTMTEFCLLLLLSPSSSPAAAWLSSPSSSSSLSPPADGTDAPGGELAEPTLLCGAFCQTDIDCEQGFDWCDWCIAGNCGG